MKALCQNCSSYRVIKKVLTNRQTDGVITRGRSHFDARPLLTVWYFNLNQVHTCKSIMISIINKHLLNKCSYHAVKIPCDRPSAVLPT